MKITSITITPEDAKNAGDYTEPGSCLLATAFKREYPNLRVLVGTYDVDVYSIGDSKDKFMFRLLFSNEDSDKISEAYEYNNGRVALVETAFTVEFTQ